MRREPRPHALPIPGVLTMAAVLLLGAGLALSAPERPTRLTPYLPEGMKRSELEHALSEDLGSGLSGAIPLALIAATTQLDPARFGASIEESYRRFGFLFLEKRSLPVGIVEHRELGLRAHQFNCLACHSGEDPELSRGARPKLVIGAFNRNVDFGGWYRVVFGALSALITEERRGLQGTGLITRTRLTARVLRRLESAAQRGLKAEGSRLTASERLTLAALVRASVSEALSGKRDPRRDEEPYGPGRTAVQSAYRTIRFNLDAGPYAPVKPPDLFGVRYRTSLLWTGNEIYQDGTSPGERIGRNGMLVPWVQIHPVTRKPIPDALTLARMPRYLRMGRLLAQASPPPAPAPSTSEEEALFLEGKDVFEQTCILCHGSYRHVPETLPDGRPGLRALPVDYEEQLVRAEDVGTDPNYALINDASFGLAVRDSLLGRAGVFKGRITRSYVARPLLGLRMRAPFLHNGSVPNLAAMLTPPEERPERFAVGWQVPYDSSVVGLRNMPDSTPGVSWRDTTGSGKRASGHPFGTDLSEAEKTALLEYLKRL